jgi:hypothetical protein
MERNPKLKFHPLNSTSIRALVEQGQLQLVLFDTRNLVGAELDLASHLVFAVDDAVRLLHRTHVLHDGIKLRPIDLRLRRHIAKAPMMLANALRDRPGERCVRMMARVVNRVQERWALVRTKAVRSVATRAIGIVGPLA